MKKSIHYFLLLMAIIISLPAVAQDWVEKMKDPSVNFFEVQKSFNKQYSKELREMERERKRNASKKDHLENTEENEMPGYAQFKRWEWFMAPRVSQTGERFDPAQVWYEMSSYYKQHPPHTFAGNWTFIGPNNTLSLSGAGRLNFVRLDPINSSTIYVGSPAGGLWKSTNSGATWSTNTDNLNHVIGCTDIGIDPTNTNTMYLVTGDGDAGDNYSVGLLKSTDGGNTWNPSGLSFSVSTTKQMSKILINPDNTNILMVATSAGIFRSTDAAATFTQVQTGSFKDMEFKPGDPNIVYACGTEFFKSTDGGQTFTKISAGLPVATNVSRMAIGTTNNDANYLYMIVGLPAPNYGTEGFYKSTNSGTSFTKVSTPNIGTQQWYDLAIASCPTNSQEVIIGGQTQFLKSTNAGVSWSAIGTTTHVDYHDLIYTSGTSIYCASDGGLYHSANNGNSFTELNNNLAISQMYGFGQSTTNPNLLITGWQDNGTNLYDGNWGQTMGGDGMLAFISHSNNNNMWGSQYNGSLNKSTNGGNSWQSATNGISEAGAWVTPWIEDPVTANTIWAGFINVWKSTNGGTSWTKKSTFTNQGTLNAIAVSKADNNVVWAAKSAGLYLTSNGGTNWTTISSLPPGTISAIECSNTDPNKAWVTFSGFTNANKVFQTNDKGATWINLSSSIPNVPVNCILYVENSNDELYIGTDVGVFFKDASINIWQPFLTGLPRVIVTQLELYYATGKIRASTYGRGMWESDLYVAGSYPPGAAFGSDNKIACPGAAVHYTDYSSGQPTQWNWSFPGGSPSTSTDQNPVVFYNSPGTFSASLIVTNANGVDSTSFNNFVTISTSPYNAPSTVGATVCGPTVANLSAAGTGTGVLRWWDAPGGGNLLNTGSTYSPNINGGKTFYIDEDFPGGSPDAVGEYSYGFGPGANFTANDIRGNYFDVLDPVVLNTVDVFSFSAGNRTIEIIDPQGNTLIDTTMFVPASPTIATTLNLNFTIYPGTGYFIKLRGLVDMWRNSSGAQFPYTSTSINITGTNAGSSGYYYFFYNWNYTTITCNTARAACVVIDSCSSAGINNLGAIGSVDIFPNPNSGIFNLNFNTQTTDNYRLKISNTIGQIVYDEKLNSFTGKFEKKIDVGSFGSGIYMLSISNSQGEIVRKIEVH
nr:T9SS type A sorting domain-containing protein [Bacteroidota bacterium]